MQPAIQFTFIQDLSLGHSRRAHELQRSNARSHAALVAHRRLKSRLNPSGHAHPPGLSSDGLGPTTLPTNPSGIYEDHPAFFHGEPCQTHTTTLPVRGSASEDGTEDRDRGENPGQCQVVARRPPPSSTWPSGVRRLHGFALVDRPVTLPNDIDPKDGAAIQFYATALMPSNDHVRYVFDVRDIYSDFFENLLDESMFNVALGLLHSALEQFTAAGSRPSPHVLRHRGKAMARIRQNLSDQMPTVDDKTLFSIVYLSILDKLLGNAAAHELHKATLAKMIEQRGGIGTFEDGTLLKGTLMHFDTMCFVDAPIRTTMFPKVRHGYRPGFPDPRSANDQLIHCDNLPPGFQDLVREKMLSRDLLSALARACHLFRLAPAERAALLSQSRHANTPFNDLWEAAPSLYPWPEHSSDSPLLALERLLSMSLLCYAYIAFGQRSVAFLLRGARNELTRTIAAYVPESPAEFACLLWMWSVAIDSWGTAYGLLPRGSSLLADLLACYPETKDFRFVQDTVRRFLWTPELEKSAHMYWSNVPSGG